MNNKNIYLASKPRYEILDGHCGAASRTSANSMTSRVKTNRIKAPLTKSSAFSLVLQSHAGAIITAEAAASSECQSSR